jgi:hypothetical protein
MGFLNTRQRRPLPCEVPAVELPRAKERVNTTMPESNQETAIRAIEKALALIHSVQTLEGTDKDAVEHLLKMAVANLKK